MESNGSPLSLDTLYFEAMADQLEDALSKLTIIEARVANLESVMETKSGDSISVNAMSDASNTAVEQALNAYKSQVLEKLKTIKETFLAEGKVRKYLAPSVDFDYLCTISNCG